MAEDDRGFPLSFACEATLNIAKQTEILELMQAASFVNLFVGIETPDVDALKQHAQGAECRPCRCSIRSRR